MKEAGGNASYHMFFRLLRFWGLEVTKTLTNVVIQSFCNLNNILILLSAMSPFQSICGMSYPLIHIRKISFSWLYWYTLLSMPKEGYYMYIIYYELYCIRYVSTTWWINIYALICTICNFGKWLPLSCHTCHNLWSLKTRSLEREEVDMLKMSWRHLQSIIETNPCLDYKMINEHISYVYYGLYTYGIMLSHMF